MKRFRAQIAILVSLSLGFEPLLVAGPSKFSRQDDVKEFLLETGLGVKGTTYKQVFQRYQLWLPTSVQSEMKNWIKQYGDQTVADVDAVPFTDKNGIEQVRMTFTKDGQTLVVTTGGTEENPTMKIGNEVITGADYYQPHRMINRFMQAEPNLGKEIGFQPEKYVITGEQFRRMPMAKRVDYIMKVRAMAESSEKLSDVLTSNKKSSAVEKFQKFWVELLKSNQAWAADYPSRGEPCIVAGHITTYGVRDDKGLSCGATDKNVLCDGGQGYRCESTIFPGAGCVQGASPDITKNCSAASPVAELKKQLQSSANDPKKTDETLKQVNEINDAVKLALLQGCGGKDDGHKLQDQDRACTELRKRFVEVEALKKEFGSLESGRGGSGESCINRGGAETVGPDGSTHCYCPGNKEVKANENCAGQKIGSGRDCREVKAEPCDCPGEMLIDQARDGRILGCKDGKKEQNKSEKSAPGFWDKYKSWIIGGAVIAGIAGLMWLMFRDKKKKCRSGYKRKNGKCVKRATAPVPPPLNDGGGTPTPVDPPAPPPILNPAEGGSGTSTSSSGGVR